MQDLKKGCCAADNVLNDPQLCHSIISSLPVGIMLLTQKFDIAFANQPANKILGGAKTANVFFGSDQQPQNLNVIESRIRQAIDSGVSCAFENITFASQGSIKIVHLNFSPLSQLHDGVDCLCTIEDRTDFARMEQQLANSQKLAAIGKMAAKVAHELNNPMDGVLRYMSLAIRIIESAGLEKPLEYLLNCKKALLRMVQIISELLEYSRNPAASYGQHDPELMLEDAIKANEMRLAPTKIIREYSLKGVKTGGPNLFQVFCNLIKNSAEAMPQGGRLTISTVKHQNNAIITISDTGPGIAKENIDKIFEPFFTTKAASKGTGLGLAICKDIVERYNGTIAAKNHDQGGCEFKITLPMRNQDQQ